jgi:hypothetical protein
MLFSNFDFLQQNFAVISKTFLDNADRATVSVLRAGEDLGTYLQHTQFFVTAASECRVSNLGMAFAITMSMMSMALMSQIWVSIYMACTH